MKARTLLLLLVILAIGGALRLWRFGSIAPTNCDEASYLRHARFMATVARKAVGCEVPIIAPEKQGIWKYVRKSDWSEKPCWLHSAFMAVPMIFWGANDAAGALVNLFFSLAAVLVVWALARALLASPGADPARRSFTDLCSLAAAGLLAVCFYWFLYSRGFWAEVDGAFFVLVSCYLLRVAIRPSRTSLPLLLSAGSAAALAVLCHYRLLFVIGPLALVAALWAGKRTWWKAAAGTIAGFAGVILVAAGVLRMAAVFASGGVPFTGLLGALMERYFPQAGGIEQKGFQPGNLLAYGWYFLRNAGVAMTLLCLVGFVGILRAGPEEKRNMISVVVFLMIPLFVLVFQIWVVARALVVAVPFACLLAGYGLATLWRSAGRLRVFAALLVLGTLLENLPPDLRFARNEMGHNKVAEFLRREKVQCVYTDRQGGITYEWYAPELRFEPFSALENAAEPPRLVSAVAIFDAQKWHTYPVRRKQITRLEERIAGENGRPVASVPNLTTAWREFLMDGTQAHSLRAMRDCVQQAQGSDIGTIRVYKLGGTAGGRVHGKGNDSDEALNNHSGL